MAAIPKPTLRTYHHLVRFGVDSFIFMIAKAVVSSRLGGTTRHFQRRPYRGTHT